MKVRTQKAYKRRIKIVFNARNKITVISTLAVPVVTYSSGGTDWKLDEIQGPDKLTSKQLCINRVYTKKADVRESTLHFMRVEEDW